MLLDSRSLRRRQLAHVEARHAKRHRRERRQRAPGTLRLEDDHRARTIRLEMWLLDDPGLLGLRDP
jgi:hypothetical protein